MALALRTLEIMLIVRRKQVPLARVAAFTKRLLDVSIFMPAPCTVAILALVRNILVVCFSNMLKI